MKEEINQLTPEGILDKDLKGTGYVCPECASGTGKNGTGLHKHTNEKGKTVWKCFSCGRTFDIIDIIREVNHVDFNNALEIGASLIGKTYHYEPKETKQKPSIEHTQEDTGIKDYSAFYEEAAKRGNYEYLLSRGISVEVQKRFNVGYDPLWINPEGNFKQPSARCIIPISRYGYLARSISDSDNKSKLSVGRKAPLFNQRVIDSELVVFIVEGEIDALSVIEVGKPAIALSGASNHKPLIKALEGLEHPPVIVLMLDGDEAGQKQQKKLLEALRDIAIQCIEAELTSFDKDPNSFLQTDREGFSRYLDILYSRALGLSSSPANNKSFLADLLYADTRTTSFEVKTGFECFDIEDKNFFGGLHEGLYCIGAISSLGKTTFCLQLADQIATLGTDVLFFSLEQSRRELISKSLSRYTAILSKRIGLSKYARTNMDILHPKKKENLLFRGQEESEAKRIMDLAIESYSEAAERLFVIEGKYKGERIDTVAISEIVMDHIKKTGRKPVVFIDYLQMISLGVDSKKTDKQLTDSTVYELKSLSRTQGIPVVAISSFNRENYTEPVSMQSFLSSSGIEYSSDILIGLQYKGMAFDPEKDKDEKTRKARVRTLVESARRTLNNRYEEGLEIELVCLKNRNGNTFSTVFNFIPWYSLYLERTIDLARR